MNIIQRLFIFLFLALGTALSCHAQTISFGNGAPLKTSYCSDDKNYAISGSQPSGGVFSGEGVFQQNGQWYFNPLLASAKAAAYPYQYQITYTVNNASVNRSVFIHKPVVIFPPLQDTFTCNGSFILNAATLYAGDYLYIWSPATGLETPAQHITKGNLIADQNFIVTAIDSVSGCQGSDTVKVINKAVQSEIEKDKERVCPGDSFYIRIQQPLSGNTYHWYTPGSGTILQEGAVLTQNFSRPGDYTFILVSTNDQCKDTLITGIHVIDVGLTLSANPDNVNQGTKVDLYSSAAVAYQVTGWSPSYLFTTTSFSSQQSLIPDSTRTYTVFALSEEGCADSASVLVKVHPNTMVPNAFSPNGDGINDFFSPQTGGDALVIGIFRIFNRYGEMIYNRQGPAAGKGWDGTYNGHIADLGTYHYYIEIATSTGAYSVYKGDVLLLR